MPPPIKTALNHTDHVTSGTDDCCSNKTTIDTATTPQQITVVFTAIGTIASLRLNTLFTAKHRLANKASQSAMPCGQGKPTSGRHNMSTVPHIATANNPMAPVDNVSANHQRPRITDHNGDR